MKNNSYEPYDKVFIIRKGKRFRKLPRAIITLRLKNEMVRNNIFIIIIIIINKYVAYLLSCQF
jgi:hypothetical protein